MPGRIIAELIRKPTRAGDSFYFVGVAVGPDGQRSRVTLFYLETRLSDDGEPVEVWELRAEPIRRPVPQEVAPPPSRRVSGRDGFQRPGSGAVDRY